MEARAAQQELLLPDAAAVAEACRSSSSNNPAPVTRAPTKSWTMSKRRGIRLHPNAADTPEAISNRADALGRVLKQCGALQLTGHISEQLDKEWARACERLGQKLVTASEAVTVANAIRTASELESFMPARGRPYPTQHVDLDAFLHDREAAPAPARALASGIFSYINIKLSHSWTGKDTIVPWMIWVWGCMAGLFFTWLIQLSRVKP